MPAPERHPHSPLLWLVPLTPLALSQAMHATTATTGYEAATHAALFVAVLSYAWALIGPRSRTAVVSVHRDGTGSLLRLPRRPLHRVAVCAGTWALAAAAASTGLEAVLLDEAVPYQWRGPRGYLIVAAVLAAVALWLTIAACAGRGRVEISADRVRVVGLLGSMQAAHRDVSAYRPAPFPRAGAVAETTAGVPVQLGSGGLAWDAAQFLAVLHWCAAHADRLQLLGHDPGAEAAQDCAAQVTAAAHRSATP